MPDIPRIELPHPIAGSGADNMRRVAEGIVDTLVAVLAGRRKGELRLGANDDRIVPHDRNKS